MKEGDSIKTERIDIKVEAETKQQLKRRAANYHMSISAYMLNCALQPDVTTCMYTTDDKTTSQLHTRLPTTVKEELIERAKMAGLSTGSVIAAALAGQKVYVVDLKEISIQTSKLGNNINQLTVLAHKGKIQAVNLTECKQLLTQNLDAMIAIKKMLKEGK